MNKTDIKPVRIQEDDHDLPLWWAVIGAGIVMGLLICAAIDDELVFKACAKLDACHARR
jgi:hypothetical protein